MTSQSLSYTPSLYGSDSDKKRQEIEAYFLETFERFELLFEPLASRDVFYKQPQPTRHPLIFYYGHTAVFYVNKLILSKVMTQRIDPHMESVFAIGVDEMSWDEIHSRESFPTVDAVKAYRQKVKALVLELIQTHTLKLPITWEDPFWWVLLMGCEHERIHLETSSVLHRQLDIEDVRLHEAWPRSLSTNTNSFPQNELLALPAAQVVLGKEHDEDFYSWDNEYGHQVVEVALIAYGKFLVSNGEFLSFVQEDGYENQAFWSESGWTWLTQDGRKYPYFWHKKEEVFYLRTMLEHIVLPLDWPVEVNFHEAQAFCRYKSYKEQKAYRLPTEAEWYRLANACDVGELFTQGNSNLKHASSTPVDHYAFGEFFDVTGNVWQWCDTSIDAFVGFKPHPMYDDFSVPTFDGEHSMIKGGSWISTGNECLKSSRYAFRPHFMQHAGFRYVVGEKQESHTQTTSVYETDVQVAQYCDFHYGPTHFGEPNFSVALVEKVLDKVSHKGRVLDLGCAVGRASFELSKHFKEVTGADFSARFIQVGTRLKTTGAIHYTRVIEGDITKLVSVRLEDLGAVNPQRIEFIQADACNLKPHLKGYDLVMALNLIDRLYEPLRFLQAMKSRINPGGILLIASPYTWLEAYTQKIFWLGGTIHEGTTQTTLEGLRAALKDSFELIEPPFDMPFVIRETQRKFQHTVSQVTLWKRL